jgi:uncharacterized protein YydD (DUF2326 family)
VARYTKISLKKYDTGLQDFSDAPHEFWNHHDIHITSAIDILDAWFDFRTLTEWNYRNILPYILPTQQDYTDVFQLQKLSSTTTDNKLFLAHLLGFDDELVALLHRKENYHNSISQQLRNINKELGGTINKPVNFDIQDLMTQKGNEIQDKQKILDSLDFNTIDKEKTNKLVDNIDVSINTLNSERYTLTYNLKRVNDSLEGKNILFNPDEAEQIFKEAGILFKGQIKKDFQQLIDFNTAMAEDRSTYLLDERTNLEAKLDRVNNKLLELGEKRAETLSFITESDVFKKFKELSKEIGKLESEYNSLDTQNSCVMEYHELTSSIIYTKEEITNLKKRIQEDTNKQKSDPASLFSSINLFFNQIVKKVLSSNALLSVLVNIDGYHEFKAEMLDESGNYNNSDLSTINHKLLCTAFDLALLRGHLHTKFPRFKLIDGIFEKLDDPKKEPFLSVIREYANIGLQTIITTYDSDQPTNK